jgi:hypothetical protein
MAVAVMGSMAARSETRRLDTVHRLAALAVESREEGELGKYLI